MAYRCPKTQVMIYEVEDIVELKKDINSWKLKKGDHGEVIDRLPNSNIYQVKFCKKSKAASSAVLIIDKEYLKRVHTECQANTSA